LITSCMISLQHHGRPQEMWLLHLHFSLDPYFDLGSEHHHQTRKKTLIYSLRHRVIRTNITHHFCSDDCMVQLRTQMAYNINCPFESRLVSSPTLSRSRSGITRHLVYCIVVYTILYYFLHPVYQNALR
jgi:hypothetical protein